MNDGAESKRRAAGGRSPAYPFINLEKALARAEELRAAVGRNDTRVVSATHHWGYGPKSSGGIQTIAALKHFGLLEDFGSGSDRRVKLTDLALRILLDQRPGSSERESFVKKAALTPKMHRELWDRWGGDLPVDAEIRHYLILDRNFNENGADDLIAEFRATISYARLTDSDSISPDASDIQTDDVEPSGGQMPNPGTADREPKRPAFAGGLRDPAQEVGEIDVVQRGRTIQISATVDANGIQKLKSILDKYEEILKLMQ